MYRKGEEREEEKKEENLSYPVVRGMAS